MTSTATTAAGHQTFNGAAPHGTALHRNATQRNALHLM